MLSPLANTQTETVLDRLHRLDKRQFRSILTHYLPRVFGQWATGRKIEIDTDDAFLRDKLVAIDREKGQLAYTFCHALDAKLVVEVGTSFGASTIYLASALRDNGVPGAMVIGTEIEPSKAEAARANLRDSGLSDLVEIRVGDALTTLKDTGGPVDFLLIDTWIPLARPAIELLAPQLRRGAIVLCDNVQQFAEAYRAYTDFVRDPANGLRSMLWPTKGGLEISVKDR